MRGHVLATADCEALRDGWLAQPVAAVSSGAFLAAAAWLACRLPAAGEGRAAAATYAGSLALVGLGSIDYHGPQSPVAAVLHDAAIVVVVAQALAVPVVRSIRRRRVLGPRRTLAVAAVAAGAGVVAYVTGRTGGAFCEPGSWAQPHAVWHVCAAVALAAWGAALWPRAPAPDERGLRARRRARSPGASSPSAAGR